MTAAGAADAVTPVTHERATEFFEGGSRNRRTIVTPEGVPVSVDIANYGERAVAFLIDIVIWFLLTLAVYLPVVSLIGRRSGFLIALSIALFLGFLVRNLYFVYFELAWRGATPGKRITGLRVIDRGGGPLVPTAVIARNLTREVEMFIPMGLMMQGEAGWEELSLTAWMLFFVLLPALNRDHMRGGDLIAGTVVISLRKRVLASDLVERTTRFTFTPQQLGVYGNFELQVLEELLRRRPDPEHARILEEVCEKICHKIGFTDPLPPAEVPAFMRDFYTAERAFLEREQLFGKARADKNSAPAAPR